jgi:hypothetical protein
VGHLNSTWSRNPTLEGRRGDGDLVDFVVGTGVTQPSEGNGEKPFTDVLCDNAAQHVLPGLDDVVVEESITDEERRRYRVGAGLDHAGGPGASCQLRHKVLERADRGHTVIDHLRVKLGELVGVVDIGPGAAGCHF